jgi:hypothetical protein
VRLEPMEVVQQHEDDEDQHAGGGRRRGLALAHSPYGVTGRGT